MNTIAKNKTAKRQDKVAKPTISKAIEPTIDDGVYQKIPLSEIELSPLNYRKYFDAKALIDFADELTQHGLIAPVTVRPSSGTGYELVAGERRWRASKIAGFTLLPAIIKNLTDEQVREIQLAENLQRENPHPLHESQAIASLQQSGKTIEQIAAKLGKSKTFVYSRIKLSGLIEVIQDIFLANKISIQEAYDIAVLSPQSQYEFYETHCTDWQDEDFQLDNLRYKLNRFKYDLTKAPFDIKSKKLVPEVGACSGCPFNSATLKSLFPEFAKEAVCSNKPCYKNKCDAQIGLTIREAVAQQIPEALLFSSGMSDQLATIIDSIPEIKDLPRYNYYDVQIFKAPVLPDREDYTQEWDDETSEFDEEGYDDAMQEYHAAVEEYTQLIKSGNAMYALYVTQQQAKIVLFSLEKQPETVSSGTTKVTAKEVQEAIKAGTATPELLQQEIDRINDRETRLKEIDADKIQLQLHEVFSEQFAVLENNNTLTAADHAAIRLVIYQSLDYSKKNAVDQMLLGGTSTDGNEGFFDRLSSLTEQQFCYLIRMAVSGKSDSKYPQNATAYFLYKMAHDAGTDVEGIEKQQAEKAAVRQDKLEARIKDLERRIEKLKQKTLLETSASQ